MIKNLIRKLVLVWATLKQDSDTWKNHAESWQKTAEAALKQNRELRQSVTPPVDNPELREALEVLLNSHSAENGSNTPDFILAGYLTDCLHAYDRATCAREEWYGRATSEAIEDA